MVLGEEVEVCGRRRGGGKENSPLRRLRQGAVRAIFGNGLLSHMKICSIIGDGELNYRVRDGIGCILSSMVTKEI